MLSKTVLKPPMAASVSFDLDALNQRFEGAHPREILAWAVAEIPQGLVQTSAFNVDDMMITDLLYRDLRANPPVPVLFLDTLHHFPETLEFVQQAQEKYGLDLRTYKAPDVDSREAFAARYGDKLWETNVEQFHHLTKIEPLQRGLAELNTVAWITGRRRDQAVTRANMPYVELDKEGRLKINPLAAWTRKQTWAYVMEHGVIYNPLHDRGYASIGDEPLTTPVAEGEDERAGRWRGMGKTECGIHI
ncbi:MAG TPA: phosphoadenosine phosphosulfate reductase [Thermosynechococcus sp. M98_K2018_005]|uniref:phosphoadenosine phosphosulfate reductase n=2 Tax=unclassified Thermosynechococcus TaxID=2622553 RepID=UPI0019F6C307|nr:phosphoadenosine phosphosulfate reductase [Thermosynechococcus sp. M98_K2018_005]HIK47365.1 phosphoadenosine phosphosulfate reductase [Thermosynechococcus sp. M55_K2018_012]